MSNCHLGQTIFIRSYMQVGGGFRKNYLKDDTGDNISQKNKNYCELTGYYWLWKNAKEDKDDILGVVHYRRGFSNLKNGIKSIVFNKNFIPLNKHECETMFLKYDFIMPIKHVFINDTVYEQYAKAHDSNDIDTIKAIISNKCPEYIESFDKVFGGHSLYTGNLFITKKELFDNYCAWLFDILFEFEKDNDMEKYDCEYNKRVYGFLSERLLNVFLQYNSFKVKELPAVNIEKYCKNH